MKPPFYSTPCNYEALYYNSPQPTNLWIKRFASIYEKLTSVYNGIINAKSSSSYPQSNPIYVILADDDNDDRQLFEEAVAELNTKIQVFTAIDGSNLMEKLNKVDIQLPGIIFLDLNMPGKTGKECLKEIKSNKRLKNIPVIIYSTSGSSNDMHETKSIGADSYIRKPDTFTGLIKIINKAFSVDWENKKDCNAENFLLNADAF
jgi:CheY-like chemotaxis protein